MIGREACCEFFFPARADGCVQHRKTAPRDCGMCRFYRADPHAGPTRASIWAFHFDSDEEDTEPCRG